ncbi:MAG: SDR family oxidoreductase [Planctomycetes bacterium]|nr:SDR family oxidoreductase [Planctomycetota bacterium]
MSDVSFRLDGQVAVVTGGASGIGLASARLFASLGAAVCLMDRHADQAEVAAAELRASGADASASGMDISDEGQVADAFATALRRHGRIDALVCNAGAGSNAPAVEMGLEAWNAAIAVNLTGTFLCAREAARHMIAAERGGAIVCTASIMGLSGGGFGNNVNYQASKGGVVNLVRGLAVEWARHRIRVNAVAPGWVRTPFIGWDKDPARLARLADLVPLGRLAEAEEIAPAIVFLAGPGAAMITGHTLPVDGGFLAR